MPNYGGGLPDDLPEGQARALPSTSTLELNFASRLSENRSITGSEGLRRIRFDQSALGSSTDGVSYSHSTCYSCTSESERRSDLEGNNNTGDNTSLLSYNSTRDIKQFVKEVNGRIFNNLADNYLLPSDEPEWVRLEKQSVALVIAMGGLYPCPDVIEAILDPADGQSKSILDVGCGTGSWAAEMARRFPHAFVLGVDVAPPPMDTGVFPPNLQFEIDDVNLGLSHFYDQYDVVHVRCVSGGIKDMDQTIVEYQKCLKPGGVLLIIEGDYNMYETKEKPARLKRLPGDPDVSGVCEDGSWLRRMVLEACVACGLAGSCVHRSSELIDLGLWDYPLMDPETARAGGLYLPIGPWAKGSSVVDTQMLQYGGALMRQSFLNIHRAYHAILLQHGMSRNVLNEWSRQIDQEITTPKKKLWVRFRFCWARRRASEGLPAPQLPKHPGRSSPPDTPPLTPRGSNSPPISPEVKDFCRPLGHRYPAIEIFTTAEEARREREKRELNVGELPELMVERTWRLMQQQTNQSQSTEATSTTSP